VSGRSGSSKWTRIGPPLAFGPSTDPTEIGIGWSWKIRRGPDEERCIRVEVTGRPFGVTDLPAKAQNAIRSRGATAVDGYLHEDEPPHSIEVSTDGLHPRYEGGRFAS
jgi:hypothetical protein